MATIKHTEWIQGMLGAPTTSVVDLNTDTIKAALIDQGAGGTITAATVAYNTPSAGLVGAAVTLTVSSISAGVVTLSGAVTFTSVTGSSAEYLTVYKDSGTPSTSPLIITWDSASTGLPVTPNGGSIVATWTSSVLVSMA